MSDAQLWELQRLNNQAKRIIAEREAEIANWEAQYDRDTDALVQKLVAAENQIVMLREVVVIAAQRGDLFKHDQAQAEAALDATINLSNCIICDAEPVRYIYRFVWYDGSEVWRDKPTCNGSTATETIPLYKARKK